MFFTGFTRFSSDVQKVNAGSVSDKKAKVAQLQEMYGLVDEAEKILTDKYSDLDEFGRLLDHTWKLKRQTGTAVSTDSIDGLYQKGMEAGALGKTSWCRRWRIFGVLCAAGIQRICYVGDVGFVIHTF